MTATDIDLHLSWPLIILLVLGALAVAFSFWSYRETLPPVSPVKQYTLSILRSLSLLLILFLVFEPIVTLVYQESQKPVVAILVDTSESMGIQDQSSDRAATVRSLIKAPELDSLAKRADIRWYGFSDGLVPLMPDSAVFSGHATDITSSLESLKNEMTGRNLGATIVLTDGQYNVGSNPAQYASLFGGPIYTVGVGEAKEQRDVFITHVLANEAAYVESVIPVDVSVSAFGYEGKKMTVSLIHDDKILQTKYVDGPADGVRVRIPFDFMASVEGMQKYEVRIQKLDGELTDKNNGKVFFIRVMKNRMRVRLISGSPGSEHSFLYQTLVDDPNVDVEALVEKKDGGFLKVSETSNRSDEAVDCYVLINYPTSTTAASTFQRFVTDILDGPKGFLVMYGPEMDVFKLSALQSVSAVEWKVDKSVEESAVPIALSLSGRHSSITKLSDQVTETSSGWAELPPVWISRVVAAPVAGSDVLARADLSRASRVLKTRGDVPLIVSRKTAKSKSLVLAAYGWWKTHFMTKGLGKSGDAYRMFMTNAVRWLSTMEDSRPVVIGMSKPVFRNGERIVITAQVHDDAFRPVNDAVVRVDVRGLSVKVPVQLNALGNGRYEGVLEGLPVGDYTIEGEGLRGEFSLGKDRAKFTVEEYSLELVNTSLSEPLLQTVATRSGGAYVPAARFGELFNLFRLESMTVEHRKEYQVWNTMILLFVLTVLFAAEWWIRKRNDML